MATRNNEPVRLRMPIPLNPKIWDAKTVVVGIGPFRHTVQFPDSDSPASITFCNNCGSPYITLPNSCAECGAIQEYENVPVR